MSFPYDFFEKIGFRYYQFGRVTCERKLVGTFYRGDPIEFDHSLLKDKGRVIFTGKTYAPELKAMNILIYSQAEIKRRKRNENNRTHTTEGSNL